MSLLVIVTVAWALVVVFACALGRAAKAGDRRELARVAAARAPVAARTTTRSVVPPLGNSPVDAFSEPAGPLHPSSLARRRARGAS